MGNIRSTKWPSCLDRNAVLMANAIDQDAVKNFTVVILLSLWKRHFIAHSSALFDTTFR